MRSKTSFFNAGLAKDLLRRFWPLWTCYFAALLFELPVRMYNMQLHHEQAYYAVYGKEFDLNSAVLGNCTDIMYISFAAGILTAMAMFGFMYSNRSCGMMSSLPIKRETMFITAFLTGLLPLLAADAAAVLAAMALLLGTGVVQLHSLLIWLLAAAMSNVAFYGFAVFCAMLTGNIIVLPLVYVVLGLTAWVAEGCVRAILSEFVYGMSVQTHFFDWLSPVITLKSELGARYDAESGRIYMNGLNWLVVYCAAGVLFSAAALFLYRRRKMETATDAVAIPILKPVFKYCMTLGCGLVLTYGLYTSLFPGSAGLAAAAAVLALMLIGAFVGYFASEMLMQKTVKVFRGKWMGYIVSACVITALTVCFELDAFGYERYIPDRDSVRSAELMHNAYMESESIDEIIRLQRQIIAGKKQNEQAELTTSVKIKYTLDSGRTIVRVYGVDCSADACNDPASDIRAAEYVLNLQEAIDNRTRTDIPITEETVISFSVDSYCYSEDYDYTHKSVQLTAAQAVEFYEQCMLPDINEGKLGREWCAMGDEYYDTCSNVNISVSLKNMDPDKDQPNAFKWDYLYIQLTMDAERTVAWLEENTDIEVLPLRVADESIGGSDNAIE